MRGRIERTLAAGLAIAAGVAAPAWAGGSTERVSVRSDGGPANSDSGSGVISSDGRFVAFVSVATNLVPGDTNDRDDVFVRDRRTGRTRRVSVGTGGVQGDDHSTGPAISADGRFVAFSSQATNLVPDDSNGTFDVFVHDRGTGVTERVSVGPGGAQGDGGSEDGVLSADGRLVAFTSFAANLVPGDTNGESDVFVRDRQTGRTTRVSVGPRRAQGDEGSFVGSLSAGGRYVAFQSLATNLVRGDTNGESDVFVHDRHTGETQKVSVGADGAQGNGLSVFPELSADGRTVVFFSSASNLVPRDTNRVADVFVRDLRTGKTRRVSVGPDGAQANGPSEYPDLSANGRVVAFQSFATNLVPRDTNRRGDVFVHDLGTGKTARVGLGPGGVQGSDDSLFPAVSGNGRHTTFESCAANLIRGDRNGACDVFVHER